MELSEFTFRIILIFVPGLISFFIIDKLTIHKEFKVHQIIINSLMLGFFCYFSYYMMLLLIKIALKNDIKFSFLKVLIDKNATINFKEIAFVTILSIPIGFLFAFLLNYKVLFRVAHKLKISKKFGDLDVWSYIMNSKIPEWVVIRDIENDLMYEGWIEAFSDSTGVDELFLRDVKVYKNSTAEEYYEIPGLYLPRKRENLSIEFPLLKFSEYKERPQRKEDKQNG